MWHAMTENGVCCTDCKVPCGIFVILGCINKTQFDYGNTELNTINLQF